MFTTHPRLIALAATLAMFLPAAGAQAASTQSAASATSQQKLGQDLEGFWTYVLQTPAPQNPFTSDNNQCHQLGQEVLAPLLPFAPASTTCTVKPGTSVFIGEMSAECSTAEAPPFHGNNEAELRSCVTSVLLGPDGSFNVHTLVVDGEAVPVRLVETPLMTVNIPPDNMLGVSAQEAQSVGMGWVTLLHPMTPGTHHLEYTFDGTFQGSPVGVDNSITIIVKPSA
jgi:hypothetical protein